MSVLPPFLSRPFGPPSPFAVPKISCSLFAHEILTAAHAYAPLYPPLAARANAAPGEGIGWVLAKHLQRHNEKSALSDDRADYG
jgi:hypothetical protein